MKVREIHWQEDRMYGQIGVIGTKRLFAFYHRIVSQSDNTTLPYTLECFLPLAPRGSKFRTRDFEAAKQLAKDLLAEFLDAVTEI